MRVTVVLLTILLYNVVFSQSVELKKILVEFYKNQKIDIEFKTNVLMDAYPLLYGKDPKPTHIHLGVPRDQVDQKAEHYFMQLEEAMKFKDKINEAKYLDSIRSVAPQCPFLLTMFGKEEKSNYNYENAIQVFQKVLEDNPNDDIAYINLKSVYGNMGRQDDAVDALKMAIMLNPLYDEYRIRNRQFLKSNGYKLESRWFTPRWKQIDGKTWEIAGPLWGYFVKAYKIFSGYTDFELKTFTGIEDREISIYYLAFEVLLHYKLRDEVQSGLLNKIQEIRAKGMLIPFIASEVIPYYPDKWESWSPELIEQVKDYYSKYYFIKD